MALASLKNAKLNIEYLNSLDTNYPKKRVIGVAFTSIILQDDDAHQKEI